MLFEPDKIIAESAKEPSFNIVQILRLLQSLSKGTLKQAAGELQTALPASERKPVTDIMATINALGLGDVPIKTILDKLGPMTLNQLRGMGGKHA